MIEIKVKILSLYSNIYIHEPFVISFPKKQNNASLTSICQLQNFLKGFPIANSQRLVKARFK